MLNVVEVPREQGLAFCDDMVTQVRHDEDPMLACFWLALHSLQYDH